MDLSFVIGTLPVAAFYFLFGLAFVLVYRTSRVINFATGELGILSPYIVLALPTFGVAWLPALAIASWIAVGFIAAALFLVALRTMTGYSPIPVILATFAISIVMRAIVELVWTSQPQFLLQESGESLTAIRWHIVQGLTWADIAVVPVALSVSLLAWALLKFTAFGTRTRAAAADPHLASYRGVHVNLTLSAAWFLAALAAGIAGMYYAIAVRLSPSVAFLGLRALAVPLLGGLDSVPGALVASFLVALVERASVRFADPLLGDVAPFALLLVGLWVRPWGLFGRPEQIERV